MGRLKKQLIVKLKASSLTEVIVATTILLVVFTIALATLNNIIISAAKKDTSVMCTEIDRLMYKYKNNQIKVPNSYIKGNLIVAIQNINHNNIKFVEFTIKNSISNKTISKKYLVNEY